MRILDRLIISPIRTFINSVALWGFETRLTFRKRNLWVALLFIIVSLVCVKAGIDEYRQADRERVKAMEIESLRTKAAQKNGDTASTRTRVFLKPNLISIFTGAPAVNQRSFAVTDSSGVLDVRASLLSGSAFTSHTPGIISFAGIIYYFGSLLFLFLGYDAYQNRDLMRFHYSTQSLHAVFNVIFFSRLFYALSFFVVTVGLACLLMVTNYVPVFRAGNIEYLLIFTGNSITFLSFFYLLGVLITNIRMKPNRALVVSAAWVAFIFIIPGILGHYIAGRANRTTSVHQLEKQRLYNPALPGENQNSKSLGTETAKLLKDYDAIVNHYLNIAQFCPSTWYLSGNIEMGGAGITGTVELFRHAQAQKKSNIFLSGQTPREKAFSGFWLQVILFPVLIYASILFHLHSVPGGFRRFRSDSKSIALPVAFKSKTMIIAPKEFGVQVYNTINCQGFGFDGKFEPDSLDGYEAVYIPHAQKLPQYIKTGWLINLVERTIKYTRQNEPKYLQGLEELNHLRKYPISQLTHNEKIILLITLAAQFPNFVTVLDDTLQDANPRGAEQITALIDHIAQKNAVLYFNTQPAYTPPVDFNYTAIIQEKEGKYYI